MIRRLVLAFVLATGLSIVIRAQQVTESVNMMPVWVPCDLATDPACASHPMWADAWRYGDIFLQRQVEGSLAPSSLNPNRLLTAFIDYSAVETFSDTGLGDSVAQSTFSRVVGAFARLFHLPRRDAGDEEEERRGPKAYAGSDAWIRLTWSTNGGATATPFFMPGAPWDSSPAGQTAPYYQVAGAASDPVVVAAPNGDFHVIFMAFQRGSANWILDARFRDLNIPDEPTRHGLTFLGFTTLASGNNAGFGTLNDKPHAIAVLDPASPVGYDIYVSYTLFNGNPGGAKFQSQLFVARSVDGGLSFTTDKVNQSTNENSGTWLLNGPGGQVFAFWRGFGSSPTMYFSKLTSAGWTKPASILRNTPLAVFDQGNVKVDSRNLPGSEAVITPRSNAFPAAAVGPDGTIYVVFQECANPGTGLPLVCSSGGSPRIMITTSKDAGTTWSNRKAFDNAIRNPEPDGLGYFWKVGRDDNTAHPQLMPSIACGAGQCLVTYWESRTSTLTASGLIGGYHRIMDLRGAALNTDGTVKRSFQISRYPYRPGTKLVALVNGTSASRPENVNDIARVNETVNPDGTRSCSGPPGVEPPLAGLEPGCIPRLNFYCRPQSGGGTTCFMGDYNAVVPATSFVRDSGGNWKVPTAPQDVPYVGFLTAASDNRNLVPPAAPLPSKGGLAPTDQLSQFTAWQPGSIGLPSCRVGGSRNTDMLLAKVNFGLLVTAPVTAKTAPSPGDGPFLTFLVQVWNNSGTARSVTFTIDPPGTTTSNGSFSKTNSTIKTGPPITINPYSSTTREIYATTAAPIYLQVFDGTTTSGITFNGVGGGTSAPTTTSAISVSDPLNISAENISAENISAENISAENISAENISAENISAENISAENLGVQETTWVIQASGDPTKAYTALATVDKAYASDYTFHVVIYRLASIGACVDDNGKTSLQYGATVVANTGLANISAENISAENISAENGFPSDASNILNNSVFTAKPAAPQTSSAQAQAAGVPQGGYRIGEGVEAQPPEREFTVVKLLAIPKKPLSEITSPYNPVKNPAAVRVSSYWCDQNCAAVQKGPDLAIGSTAPSVTPAALAAGQLVVIDAYSVPNAGTTSAGPRRYGYYLSKHSTLDLLPSGLADTTKDVFLGSVDVFTDSSSTLAPGSIDSLGPQTFTLPLSTTPGAWYLFIYADDLRHVSELNEDNNITRGTPITILSDIAPPVFSGYADVGPIEATGAVTAVTYISPTAIDAVDGSVAVTCAPTPGSTFPIGSTPVVCTATDKSQNQASVTFTVTVRDTTPPAITGTPGNMTKEAVGSAGAPASWTVPTAIDAVDGADAVTCLPASGSTFSLGNTTVRCTATDARGNSATTSFVVTVRDTTPPTMANSPGNMTKEAIGPAGAPASWAPPTAVDTVDGADSVVCLPVAGSTFPLGVTTVTCSATDSHSNSARLSFVVAVVDTTPPMLTLPAPVAPATSLSGVSVTYAASAVDLVDGARPVSCSPPSASSFPIGRTTVSCSASDTRGNTATGSFVVTVKLQYGFVGVQNLPAPGGKTFNPGSAVPLKWRFTLNDVAVDSTGASPAVTITGPNGSQSFTPADPGSSSFQPPTAANGWTWQFNWQTVNTSGIYNVTIGSRQTGDTFSGGQIALK